MRRKRPESKPTTARFKKKTVASKRKQPPPPKKKQGNKRKKTKTNTQKKYGEINGNFSKWEAGAMAAPVAVSVPTHFHPFTARRFLRPVPKPSKNPVKTQ